MDKLIITISRQYGSGGRELAQILSKKLNIKLYDRQIVHKAAIKLGYDHLDEKDILYIENDLQKTKLSTYLPFHSFGSSFGISSTEMFLQEAKVIHKLAENNSCIILGRCGDYILRKKESIFKIFVCADDEFRIKRGQSHYDNLDLKMLNKEDEKRAQYYNYYTGQSWGKPETYDLVVNTSKTDLDIIADGIISYIEKVKM